MSIFGPAHAVVIDCALFLAAQVMSDDRTEQVWDQLTRALPQAHPIGDPEIDRVTEAAADYLAARAAMHTKPGANTSTENASAHWGLRSAVDRYAWARLTKSATAFSATPNQRPAK